MLTIKNPDREIRKGKLTIYEDVPDTVLEDLNCPCCNKHMKFLEEDKHVDQRSIIHIFRFVCDDCYLTFEGIDDYYRFHGAIDFYNTIKWRLENAQNNS